MKSLLLLLLVLPLSARLQPERSYQEWFAAKHSGKLEVVMGDGTRCDILTETHAIEVDFADKWAEAIGQALNYSFQANRKAGIVLVVEKQSDYRYFIRLNSIIRHHGLKINLWPVYVYKGEGPTGGERPPQPLSGKGFWITSTGKTHNPSCRYYGRTRAGAYSTKGSGNDCRICGGAVR